MGPTVITTVTAPAVGLFQGGQPYDLVDLATVKDELLITGDASDAFLKRAITQVSADASRFCNRVFPVEGLVEQIYAWRDTTRYSVLSGERLDPLQLARWPIASPPCLAGLAAPTAPLLASVAGGALAAARYFVQITYVTAAGETAASTEVAFSVAANSLLQVPSPAGSTLAAGWNVYVATASGKEIKQNSAPIAIGTSWTEPTTGLSAEPGVAVPGFVAVVENAIPLAEGVDFLVKYDVGQLVRLDTNGWPKPWPSRPIVVSYQAGFSAIPSDVQDGALRLIKIRYYGRTRDPMLRQENIAGVWEGSWWFASGPGASTGNMPPDVEAILEKYRVPVIG